MLSKNEGTSTLNLFVMVFSNDTSNIVKKITGHEPRSFKTYIKEHLELFESISA